MSNRDDLIEKYPHLKYINESWGTFHCREFLFNLILDTREGNRQGFPLEDMTVIMDLLSEHDLKFPKLEEGSRPPSDVWSVK